MTGELRAEQPARSTSHTSHRQIFRVFDCLIEQGVNHVQVSSAFSQLLNLHNLTEEISNAQHERAVRMGEASHNDNFMLIGTCIADCTEF